MPECDEARPAGSGTGIKSSGGDIESVSDSLSRCAHCDRAIWSAESIRTGLGRHCRQAVVA